MPINNNFFGVYKSFKLGTQRVVASDVTRNREMSVSPQNYVQGTPKARVLDIGGVSETLSITAPLFVGGGSAVDGRSICNKKIREILGLETPTLPILSSANFNISAEQTSVSLSLESDGDPNNTQAFEIRSDEVPELDPITYTPTRLAKFYDIRVQIGTRKYFVTQANLTVSAQTDKRYFFIPGDWGDYRGWGSQTTTPPYGDSGVNVATGVGSTNVTIVRTGYSSIQFQPGTQFPFLGVAGIQIKGSGSAAVLMEDLNSDGDYLDNNETINLSLQPGTTDMTLQDPGYVRSDDAQFRIEIFDPVWLVDPYNTSGSGWSSFLAPELNLSKSVVHSSNFKLSSGLLTVDFDFACWVK